MQNKLYALIAEGKGERVILNILLDNNLLKVTRDDLLEGEVISTRSAKKFEARHLNFKIDADLHIYRVLDSDNEKFELTSKNTTVVNILTKPEIEMLTILDQGLYNSFSLV